MVKFETNGKLGKASINLPTSINELTGDYLYCLTNHISVADNYSLIALCHREKLSNFVIAGRGSKNEMSTAVVPIFVKCGKTDVVFINEIKEASKVIISPSALSLGYHVNVATNDLTMGKFAALIDGDKDAMRNALALNTDVYFMEFKLIPNNEIVGVYKTIKCFDNTFKITRENNDSVAI